MAYDEGLAQRVREALSDQSTVVEKKMFGGLAFMVDGHMCCGVTSETLMVRVGPDAHAAALAQPHTRPMDFTGRPLKGMVYVDPEGYEEDKDLQTWVERGLAFTNTLPAK